MTSRRSNTNSSAIPSTMEVQTMPLDDVMEWAALNGIKQKPQDTFIKRVNSRRAELQLPRFRLSQRTLPSGHRNFRPRVPKPPQRLVSTQEALMDLVSTREDTVSCLVDAEIASWLLELNTGNRPLLESNIERFRRILRSKQWVNTGEPVIVSREAILNDGQHRLIAIRDTGIAAEVDIRFGVAREAFHATGTGKRRSASHVLAIEGYSNTSCQASIARLVKLYDQKAMGNSRQGTVEPAEILKIVDADDRIPEVAAKIQRISGMPICRTGGFGFVLAIARRNHESEKVFEFADQVASGLGLDEELPARRLHVRFRDAAVKRERLDSVAVAAMTVKAWNAWVSDTKISPIRLTETDRSSAGFPTIR